MTPDDPGPGATGRGVGGEEVRTVMGEWTRRLTAVLFFGATALAAVAVFEKLMHQLGIRLLSPHYDPWRLLEFSAVLLLFVIALELRDLRARRAD
jgi:hypothetical protein